MGNRCSKGLVCFFGVFSKSSGPLGSSIAQEHKLLGRFREHAHSRHSSTSQYQRAQQDQGDVEAPANTQAPHVALSAAAADSSIRQIATTNTAGAAAKEQIAKDAAKRTGDNIHRTPSSTETKRRASMTDACDSARCVVGGALSAATCGSINTINTTINTYTGSYGGIAPSTMMSGEPRPPEQQTMEDRGTTSSSVRGHSSRTAPYHMVPTPGFHPPLGGDGDGRGGGGSGGSGQSMTQPSPRSPPPTHPPAARTQPHEIVQSKTEFNILPANGHACVRSGSVAAAAVPHSQMTRDNSVNAANGSSSIGMEGWTNPVVTQTVYLPDASCDTSAAAGTASGTASGTATGTATGTASGTATGTASGTATGTASGFATGTAAAPATGGGGGGGGGGTAISNTPAGKGGPNYDAAIQPPCTDVANSIGVRKSGSGDGTGGGGGADAGERRGEYGSRSVTEYLAAAARLQSHPVSAPGSTDSSVDSGGMTGGQETGCSNTANGDWGGHVTASTAATATAASDAATATIVIATAVADTSTVFDNQAMLYELSTTTDLVTKGGVGCATVPRGHLGGDTNAESSLVRGDTTGGDQDESSAAAAAEGLRPPNPHHEQPPVVPATTYLATPSSDSSPDIQPEAMQPSVLVTAEAATPAGKAAAELGAPPPPVHSTTAHLATSSSSMSYRPSASPAPAPSAASARPDPFVGLYSDGESLNMLQRSAGARDQTSAHCSGYGTTATVITGTIGATTTAAGSETEVLEGILEPSPPPPLNRLGQVPAQYQHPSARVLMTCGSNIQHEPHGDGLVSSPPSGLWPVGSTVTFPPLPVIATRSVPRVEPHQPPPPPHRSPPPSHHLQRGFSSPGSWEGGHSVAPASPATALTEHHVRGIRHEEGRDDGGGEGGGAESSSNSNSSRRPEPTAAELPTTPTRGGLAAAAMGTTCVTLAVAAAAAAAASKPHRQPQSVDEPPDQADDTAAAVAAVAVESITLSPSSPFQPALEQQTIGNAYSAFSDRVPGSVVNAGAGADTAVPLDLQESPPTAVAKPILSHSPQQQQPDDTAPLHVSAAAAAMTSSASPFRQCMAAAAVVSVGAAAPGPQQQPPAAMTGSRWFDALAREVIINKSGTGGGSPGGGDNGGGDASRPVGGRLTATTATSAVHQPAAPVPSALKLDGELDPDSDFAQDQGHFRGMEKIVEHINSQRNRGTAVHPPRTKAAGQAASLLPPPLTTSHLQFKNPATPAQLTEAKGRSPVTPWGAYEHIAVPARPPVGLSPSRVLLEKAGLLKRLLSIFFPGSDKPRHSTSASTLLPPLQQHPPYAPASSSTSQSPGGRLAMNGDNDRMYDSRYGNGASAVATTPASTSPPSDGLRERQVEVGSGGLPAGAQRTGSYTELSRKQPRTLSSVSSSLSSSSVPTAAPAGPSASSVRGGGGGGAASVQDGRTLQPNTTTTTTAAVTTTSQHPISSRDTAASATSNTSQCELPPATVLDPGTMPAPASASTSEASGPIALPVMGRFGAALGPARGGREPWDVTYTTVHSAAAAMKREAEAITRVKEVEARAADAEARAVAAQKKVRQLEELHAKEERRVAGIKAAAEVQVAAVREQARRREQQMADELQRAAQHMKRLQEDLAAKVKLEQKLQAEKALTADLIDRLDHAQTRAQEAEDELEALHERQSEQVVERDDLEHQVTVLTDQLLQLRREAVAATDNGGNRNGGGDVITTTNETTPAGVSSHYRQPPRALTSALGPQPPVLWLDPSRLRPEADRESGFGVAQIRELLYGFRSKVTKTAKQLLTHLAKQLAAASHVPGAPASTRLSQTLITRILATAYDGCTTNITTNHNSNSNNTAEKAAFLAATVAKALGPAKTEELAAGVLGHAMLCFLSKTVWADTVAWMNAPPSTAAAAGAASAAAGPSATSSTPSMPFGQQGALRHGCDERNTAALLRSHFARRWYSVAHAVVLQRDAAAAGHTVLHGAEGGVVGPEEERALAAAAKAVATGMAAAVMDAVACMDSGLCDFPTSPTANEIARLVCPLALDVLHLGLFTIAAHPLQRLLVSPLPFAAPTNSGGAAAAASVAVNDRYHYVESVVPLPLPPAPDASVATQPLQMPAGNADYCRRQQHVLCTFCPGVVYDTHGGVPHERDGNGSGGGFGSHGRTQVGSEEAMGTSQCVLQELLAAWVWSGEEERVGQMGAQAASGSKPAALEAKLRLSTAAATGDTNKLAPAPSMPAQAPLAVMRSVSAARAIAPEQTKQAAAEPGLTAPRLTSTAALVTSAASADGLGKQPPSGSTGMESASPQAVRQMGVVMTNSAPAVGSLHTQHSPEAPTPVHPQRESQAPFQVPHQAPSAPPTPPRSGDTASRLATSAAPAASGASGASFGVRAAATATATTAAATAATIVTAISSYSNSGGASGSGSGSGALLCTANRPTHLVLGRSAEQQPTAASGYSTAAPAQLHPSAVETAAPPGIPAAAAPLPPPPQPPPHPPQSLPPPQSTSQSDKPAATSASTPSTDHMPHQQVGLPATVVAPPSPAVPTYANVAATRVAVEDRCHPYQESSRQHHAVRAGVALANGPRRPPPIQTPPPQQQQQRQLNQQRPVHPAMPNTNRHGTTMPASTSASTATASVNLPSPSSSSFAPSAYQQHHPTAAPPQLPTLGSAPPNPPSSLSSPPTTVPTATASGIAPAGLKSSFADVLRK